MRVLVITNMYPPHHLGGYELWCRDVVELWRRRGHEVLVLTTDLRLDDSADTSELGVERDLKFYWRDHEFLTPTIRERIAIERHNQRMLKDTIMRFKPDVVSVWHMGGMSLGLLTTVTRGGLPMVFVVHDDWLSYARRADAWMNAFMKRPIARRAARLAGVPTTIEVDEDNVAFCFVSDYIRRHAPEEWPTKRSAIVPSGIDLAEFPPAAAHDDWMWRLLCVGRLEARKGAHVAVEALALLPGDATLSLLGPADDTYLRELEAQIAAQGLDGRVSFDAVPRSELAAEYGRADVFLFPVVWDEPWGLTPIEAMACGVPVIATGTGGSAEFLVDGSNCLLVPPNDSRALATAIERLAGDSALREQLVRGGHETAKRFDADTLATDLEAWHLAAVKGFPDQ